METERPIWFYLFNLVLVTAFWIFSYNWHPFVVLYFVVYLFPSYGHRYRFFGILKYFVSNPARVALLFILIPYGIGLIAARRAAIDIPELDGQLTWFEALLTATLLAIVLILTLEFFHQSKSFRERGGNN